MKKWMVGILGTCMAGGVSSHGAPRDIQFRSIDFDAAIMEFFNFGTATQNLNGWRFCSRHRDLSGDRIRKRKQYRRSLAVEHWRRG